MDRSYRGRAEALCELLGIELPILQAPMAGAQDHELAVAVAAAGGLGALPCAVLEPDAIVDEVSRFRALAGGRPINLNFFCHPQPDPDPQADASWLALLAPYYDELGIDTASVPDGPGRGSFDVGLCEVVEQLTPEVVSFHFGLPEPALLDRVRATGARVLSSATTVQEAEWLAGAGVDAIIAQGAEAGGHRGMFLSDDPGGQVGTFALVPQVADAVDLPVVAAGGVADARGVAAALVLGASAVQVGTAYLRCPEARIAAPHREALAAATADGTRVTNVYTGRPARGLETRVMRELGPLTDAAPAFPRASRAIAPLRAAAEAAGSGDFSLLWAGQAAALASEMGAAELTRRLAGGAGEPPGGSV